MDGLECSEICCSKVLDTLTVRLDSDYYQKKYLKTEQYIATKQSQFVTLKSLGLKVDASAFYPSLEPYYNKGTIPFIRVADVKDVIDYDNCVTLPKMGTAYDTLYMAHNGDLVLTKGGRVGTAGLISKDCYITRDLIYLNSSNLSRPDYITLYLFFCTDFMYQQMIRSSSMTAQPHLTITLIRELLVSTFSEKFKKMLSAIFDRFEELYKHSKESYKTAEGLLISSLGLNPISKQQRSISIKQLNESFAISGRLDAEYYQPKFDELFALLQKQPTKPLGGKNGIVTIKKSIEPGSDAYVDEGVSFVRVSDITKYGISVPSIKLSRDIVPDISALYPHKDTILFSKDGSVGIAYKVQKDMEIVTSGALLHLTVNNPDEILPDYLTLVLNSKIVQLQAERNSSGAIIQHWKASEIEKVVIPVLDFEIQKDISVRVQESFALRHQSEELLDRAKRAVEIAIEQGEDKAMEWLKENGVEC